MKLCWWTMGPNTHHTELLNALRAIGIDVEVCYFHGRYRKDRLKMGWKDPALKPWEHYVKTIREAKRIIPDFDTRIQMVPSFFNLTSWKVVLWSCLHGHKWFALTEGTRGRLVMRPLFRLFCSFVDRFALGLFAEGGEAVRRQYIKGGVRSDKTVAYAYATMTPPKLEVQKEEKLTFVFAGEFCKRKAVDVIVAAFKRVYAEFPNIQLIMAGGGDLVEVVNDVEGVVMVGAIPQNEIYSVIGRGHVILLPSRYDPWGAALVEGGMCGLAMIGSDHTRAALTLIENGVNGYIVKAGDEDELVSAMRAYARKPILVEKHGQKARDAVEGTSGKYLAKLMIENLQRWDGES